MPSTTTERRIGGALSVLASLIFLAAAGCGIWDLGDVFGSGGGGSHTSACAAVFCPADTHCEEKNVVCVRAPCPPIAECVSDASPDASSDASPDASPGTASVRCGGFAGLPCPGGGRCVDDPSDDCDPANGGADCIGMCVCVETVLCTQDKVFDGAPDVCACVAR